MGEVRGRAGNVVTRSVDTDPVSTLMVPSLFGPWNGSRQNDSFRPVWTHDSPGLYTPPVLAWPEGSYRSPCLRSPEFLYPHGEGAPMECACGVHAGLGVLQVSIITVSVPCVVGPSTRQRFNRVPYTPVGSEATLPGVLA